ncbi:MAG: PrnB family protein [Steroidobacteraceae bacterium]
MTSKAENFDRWIRSSFVEMNTALENLYFSQSDRGSVEGIGDAIKAKIRDAGRVFVVGLLEEGNTGDGFESGFGVLGNVGLYLAALRRHELTNPAREERSPFAEASSLALHVGVSLGMAPRFATGHLATHNLAINGVQKSFTSLADEKLFLDENTCGILCFQRAADVLARIVPLGVSHAATRMLLTNARDAIHDAMQANARLFSELDTDRFFYCVRPYYKPYRVGRQEYRGANAGDFSGINEIDLLLGLCKASDPYYAQLLLDKMLFMLPVDQARLKDCMTRTSLLDEFLAASERSRNEPWFRANAAAFLEVCSAFGRTAEQHHNELVEKFIRKPAESIPPEQLAGITASGPPLPVLLRSLEVLRDLRVAAPRSDIASRHACMARLKRVLAA